MAVKSKRNSSDAGLSDGQLTEVAQLFAVLSEPTRLRIIQFLERTSPATVGEIVAATRMKQANASKQLGILHAAGVLARTKDGVSVRYSIALPLVFDLCRLVCGGLRERALARAATFE